MVAEYLSGIERRDAQLAALSGLRSSLLGLADAHTAAAAGSRRPFDEVLKDVQGCSRMFKDVNDWLARTEAPYKAIDNAGDAR